MSTTNLIDQFTMNHWAAMKSIDGIDHDESVKLPEVTGNSMNWVLGHITLTRSEILEMLAAKRLWEESAYEVYKRGADRLTDPSRATDFDAIRHDYAASQEPLLEALEAQNPEALSSRVDFSFVGRDEDSLEAVLAGFAFHEAYHVGQLGLLRRFLGHPGVIK